MTRLSFGMDIDRDTLLGLFESLPFFCALVLLFLLLLSSMAEAFKVEFFFGMTFPRRITLWLFTDSIDVDGCNVDCFFILPLPSGSCLKDSIDVALFTRCLLFSAFFRLFIRFIVDEFILVCCDTGTFGGFPFLM